MLLVYFSNAFSCVCNHQISISIAVSLSERSAIEYTLLSSSVYQVLMNLYVFPSEVQAYFWILWCWNIVHLTTRYFYMKQLIVFPLSLLVSCKLSLVGLKLSFLPEFVLSLINFSYGTKEIDQMLAVIHHKICPLCHHIYSWCMRIENNNFAPTNCLFLLNVTSYPNKLYCLNCWYCTFVYREDCS